MAAGIVVAVTHIVNKEILAEDSVWPVAPSAQRKWLVVFAPVRIVARTILKQRPFSQTSTWQHHCVDDLPMLCSVPSYGCGGGICSWLPWGYCRYATGFADHVRNKSSDDVESQC